MRLDIHEMTTDPQIAALRDKGIDIGVAVTGRNTLALINDNDFGMTDGAEAFDANGRLVDSRIETSLTVVELPRPLHG